MSRAQIRALKSKLSVSMSQITGSEVHLCLDTDDAGDRTGGMCEELLDDVDGCDLISGPYLTVIIWILRRLRRLSRTQTKVSVLSAIANG